MNKLATMFRRGNYSSTGIVKSDEGKSDDNRNSCKHERKSFKWRYLAKCLNRCTECKKRWCRFKCQDCKQMLHKTCTECRRDDDVEVNLTEPVGLYQEVQPDLYTVEREGPSSGQAETADDNDGGKPKAPVLKRKREDGWQINKRIKFSEDDEDDDEDVEEVDLIVTAVRDLIILDVKLTYSEDTVVWIDVETEFYESDTDGYGMSSWKRVKRTIGLDPTEIVGGSVTVVYDDVEETIFSL